MESQRVVFFNKLMSQALDDASNVEITSDAYFYLSKVGSKLGDTEFDEKKLAVL